MAARPVSIFPEDIPDEAALLEKRPKGGAEADDRLLHGGVGDVVHPGKLLMYVSLMIETDAAQARPCFTNAPAVGDGCDQRTQWSVRHIDRMGPLDRVGLVDIRGQNPLDIPQPVACPRLDLSDDDPIAWFSRVFRVLQHPRTDAPGLVSAYDANQRGMLRTADPNGSDAIVALIRRRPVP